MTKNKHFYGWVKLSLLLALLPFFAAAEAPKKQEAPTATSLIKALVTKDEKTLQQFKIHLVKNPHIIKETLDAIGDSYFLQKTLKFTAKAAVKEKIEDEDFDLIIEIIQTRSPVLTEAVVAFIQDSSMEKGFDVLKKNRLLTAKTIPIVRKVSPKIGRKLDAYLLQNMKKVTPWKSSKAPQNNSPRGKFTALR